MLKAKLRHAVWLAAILVIFSALPVKAQTELDKLGLTVSPVVDEFTAKPGMVLERTIKITNPVRDSITLYPVTLNFTTDNTRGQPKFYSLNERSSRYALSEWIAYPKPLVRIAPGEFELFPYTVTVPEEAEPGGHYGAVLFSTEPPKVDSTTNQVSVVGLIGTLVLATVPGDIVHRTVIDDFSAPSFLMKSPANFSLTFSNLGNVHSKPNGEIKIRNTFGSVVETLKVNDKLSNVLPESKRTFDIPWTFDWRTVGKYTATAAITYGTPEQQLTSVRSFYVIPLWFVIAIALIILLFFSGTIYRRRRKKAYVKTVSPPQPKKQQYVMR